MMRTKASVSLSLLLLCAILSGCGKEELVDPNELPTTPVTGKVMVDGQPVAMIRVVAKEMADPPRSANAPSAYTDKDGQFSLRTFRDGDGAPSGEYRLTFQYGSYAIMKGRQYKGDKFKGKYMKKETSKFPITVKEGEPLDVGTIELTTGEKSK